MMKNESQDGLPEIAQQHHKKKPVVLVIIGIVLLVFFVTVWNMKPVAKKVNQAVEETYTPEPEVSKEVKETLSASPPKKEPELSDRQKAEMLQMQVALMQEQQKELQQRLSAPLMVVNNAPADNKVQGASQQKTISSDANMQFMNQVSSTQSDTVNARMIGPLNTVIAEGSLIHAILEPATNSDLPGALRAIVSEPHYSEDGTQILIPRGSRLIGQYKSGMLQGQSRIFVVWTRLITPAGVSVALGSSGIDSLGVAGMGADEIDRHFFERFGNAALLSIIGAGASNVGVQASDQENSASAYRTAIANSFAQSASQSLQQEGQIPPTLKTYQGKPIMVFVAHDLNFQDMMKETKSKRNVF